MLYEAININQQLQQPIMKVLHYYSIFKYPVTAEEIKGSCSIICTLDQVNQTLTSLVNTGDVSTYHHYYSLHTNIIELVEAREKANKLAIEKIRSAKRAAKQIYSFPFVKFVGISGSLSKGHATNDSDFDFFIVTDKNRLWISRTILHLFKKLTFITGRQHRFCMNYFVDTDALCLKDKNIFTAIELSSLIPLHGSEVYNSLMSNNKWSKELLPNGYVPFKKSIAISDRSNFFKTAFTSVLNLLAPDNLNNKLMQLTDTRWRKKWAAKGYPMEDYNVAFMTTEHISKNHPANYQKKILSKLAQAGYKD